MTKLAKRMEELFTDITFAEDREIKSASEYLEKVSQALEDDFMATAFAEAGEFKTAITYINKNGSSTRCRGGSNVSDDHTQHLQDLLSAGS
ncbi:MAG: hypothetical protein OEW04_14495 [Nitrospirota bacterium]|nr:hypothetical protein [Nitrospirota bacterium]